VSLVDASGNLLIAGWANPGFPPTGPETVVPLPGARWTRLWSQPEVLNLGETEDGQVVAWGFGSDSDFALPEGLAGWKSIAAIRLTGGTWGFGALRKDSSVAVWGGACAPPESLGKVNALVPWGEGFLALRSDGSLVSWGDTLAAPAGAGIRTLEGDGNTVMATDGDGRRHVWGKFRDTLEAILTAHPQPRKAQLKFPTFCLVTDTDSLLCYAQRTTPHPALRLRRSDDIVQIEATWMEVFVLHADGQVEGWD
jgi:alpha-tubulin suppressor-like RCC1 family protein